MGDVLLALAVYDFTAKSVVEISYARIYIIYINVQGMQSKNLFSALKQRAAQFALDTCMF